MISMHSNGGDPAIARVITDIAPDQEKQKFRGDFEAWLNSVPHFPRSINSIPQLTQVYKLLPTSTDEMLARRNALQLASAIYIGDDTLSLSTAQCDPQSGTAMTQNRNNSIHKMSEEEVTAGIDGLKVLIPIHLCDLFRIEACCTFVRGVLNSLT